MTPIDVTMSEEDKEIIRNFIVTNEQAKRVDKNKKKLNEEVKVIFDKYKINDPLVFEGSTLTITESTRKTVSKAKKDQFIQALVNMGKNYLVIPSVDIDTETIVTELENGQLDESFVKQYMSITPVKTLTVK
jgi:hypothetical protein